MVPASVQNQILPSFYELNLISIRVIQVLGFPVGSDGKESACNAENPGSISGLGRSPGEGNGNPLQYSCLENPHGQRSLVGYSPWGCKESDTTEQLSTAQYRYYKMKSKKAAAVHVPTSFPNPSPFFRGNTFLITLAFCSEIYLHIFSNVLVSCLIFFQSFSCSVAQSCPILCDPMDCSMPGPPVLHHLLEVVQSQVH